MMLETIHNAIKRIEYCQRVWPEYYGDIDVEQHIEIVKEVMRSLQNVLEPLPRPVRFRSSAPRSEDQGKMIPATKQLEKCNFGFTPDPACGNCDGTGIFADYGDEH